MSYQSQGLSVALCGREPAALLSDMSSYPFNNQGHPNQPPVQYPPQMMQVPMHHMMPMYGQNPQMPMYMPPHMVPGQPHPMPGPHQQAQFVPAPAPPPQLSEREQMYARKCRRAEREIQQVTAENINIQEEWCKGMEVLQRLTTENSMLVGQIAKVEPPLNETAATTHKPTKTETELFGLCYGRNFHDPAN